MRKDDDVRSCNCLSVLAIMDADVYKEHSIYMPA